MRLKHGGIALFTPVAYYEVCYGLFNLNFKGEKKMKREILSLLEKNARISNADIAAVVGITESEVARLVGEMEADGIIKGYKCVVDRERLEDDGMVSAIIELKVTPQAEFGFEDVAMEISRYPEVESVSLMSGACDLIVTVKGRSFREVATFVAEEIAVIDAVTSTATQFIMRRYKEYGVELFGDENDERSILSL